MERCAVVTGPCPRGPARAWTGSSHPCSCPGRRAKSAALGEEAPLDLEDDQGRIYINTGTWRPIHSRCEGKEREFVSAHVMSYAAIYKDDERKGRRYETWTGTLGVGQGD